MFVHFSKTIENTLVVHLCKMENSSPSKNSRQFKQETGNGNSSLTQSFSVYGFIPALPFGNKYIHIFEEGWVISMYNALHVA